MIPLNALDEAVGPYYDTTGLTRWLGIAEQALAQRVTHGTLLGVKSSDGYWMYPAFQFDERGESLPRLREVLDAIDPGRLDAWSSAIWLNHPMRELGGRTPAEVLRSSDSDAVVRIARRIQSALAS